MNSWAGNAERVFEWVLQSSWQAAVLVGLILLGQWLLGRRLSPQWRYGLWFLLVGRLLMPASPHSAVSIFNLVRSPAQIRATQAGASRPAYAPLSSAPDTMAGNPGPTSPPVEQPGGQLAPQSRGEPFKPEAASGSEVLWPPPLKVQEHRSIARGELAFWLWLGGLAAMSVTLGLRHARFNLRIRSHVLVSDPNVLRLFEGCRERLQVGRAIQLIETEEVETPAVYGLWRKRLLLPDGTFERYTPEELRHIFLHELAHIRRRDLEVNWIAAVLQVIHWFNPVLWYAFARMRSDRELATDALALSVNQEQDSASYGETLLKVLAGLRSGSVQPGVVGIAEGKARLKRRLQAIAGHGNRHPWRWIALVLFSVISAVALTDAIQPNPAQTGPVAKKLDSDSFSETRRPRSLDDSAAGDSKPQRISVQQAQPSTNLNSGEFAIHIVDFDTLVPVSGVKVHLDLEYYSKPSTTQEMNTGENGRAALLFEASDLKKLSYRLDKEGYVSLQGRWFAQQVALLQDPFEIKLSRGTEIGGQVVNNNGRAVAGAEIFFDRPMNMFLVNDHQIASQVWSVTGGQHVATTDSNGRWTARPIWQTVQWAALRVRHAGFADSSYSTESTKAMEAEGKAHPLSFSDLVAKRAIFTLSPGLTVNGRVLDASGKLLAGVPVRYADRRSENPFWDDVMGKGNVTTDQTGRFKVADLPRKRIFFTVQIPDYAPMVRELDLDSSPPEIELRLKEGQQLFGSVVDLDGNPVSGVRLTFQDWSIWQGVRWSALTDQNGQFKWDDAPLEPFQVVLEKEEFIRMRKTLQGGGHQEIQLKPALKLSGKVVDAKTHDPIKEFRIHWSDREEYLSHSKAENIVGTAGSYMLDLGRIYTSMWGDGYFGRFIFQVEAEGYLPATSRLFSSQNDVGEIAYNLELQPAKMIAGVVLCPDGRPAAGAQLALRSPTARLRLAGKPRFEDLDKQPFPTADGAGKFRLARDSAATHLIAVHSQGVAYVELKGLSDNPVVHLQPWGRVEGTVAEYEKPLTNEEVWLQWREPYNLPPGIVGFDLLYSSSRSDSAGRFAFDYVLPGKCALYRMIPMHDGMASSSSVEITQVQPGGTVHVQIGGSGRPVVGRFKVKNPYVPIDWEKLQFPPAADSILPKPPEGVKTRAEYDTWRNQEPIQRASDTQRHYPIHFAADGSFRMDEVVPGKYHFTGQIYDPRDPDATAYRNFIADFDGEFEVPASPEQNSRVLLDIGTFELTLRQQLEPGKTIAPEIAASDLEGRPLDLSHFRGKYVVLDFWATWCGPCVAAMPYLKRTFDQFKTRDNFAMISLSEDESIERVREFAKKNSSPWVQGFLGRQGTASAEQQYGLRGIPAIFLIGPDGKILATDIEPDALMITVKKHLR